MTQKYGEDISLVLKKSEKQTEGWTEGLGYRVRQQPGGPEINLRVKTDSGVDEVITVPKGGSIDFEGAGFFWLADNYVKISLHTE